VLHRFPVYEPVVAAVNGTCVAGGSTVRLPCQIPYALAMELLLTADMVDAQRALTMGLLNQVVPADQLMTTAYDLRRADRGQRAAGGVCDQTVSGRRAHA
jgi:enoyl-CoA hydratase